jgi:hypothetical protein
MTYSVGLSKAVAFSRGESHSVSNNFVAGFDEFYDGDQGSRQKTVTNVQRPSGPRSAVTLSRLSPISLRS